MRLSALKDKMLSLRALIALKSNKIPRSNSRLKKIHSIGLICDTNDESLVKNKSQDFMNNKFHCHIEIICIASNNGDVSSANSTCPSISYKDISWGGGIKNQNLVKFINEPFDYLVFLSSNNNPLARLILAKTKSKCRVSVYSQDLVDYCDFMVKLNQNTDKSIDIIIEKIFNYLGAISKI